MILQQFYRKALALQELAKQGLLRVGESRVVRNPRLTAAYKSDVIRRVWQQYSHNPEFRNRAIQRVQSMQIWQQIRNLPPGTSITGVDIIR
jgi:hypothetical protein